MERDDGDTSPAAVYETLAPAVLGYFRSHRMRDPEGLTGDVFVAVTAKFDGFRGDDDSLRRWVFTIAHNRRVDEIRRSDRRPEILVAEPSAPPTRDQSGDHVPFDADLVAAIGRLTPEQREVVALRFVADLSVRSVAAITGRRTGAVKMLQTRALEALARDLKAHTPAATP